MKVNNCIKNLLKLICLLQKNAKNNRHLEDGCCRPFLGPDIVSNCYNTRVITLYNKNANIFTANYTDENGDNQTSSFFRIERVFDDCSTLLILKKNGNNYSSTKQTITVRLSCICAIKCIEDVTVDNL